MVNTNLFSTMAGLAELETVLFNSVKHLHSYINFKFYFSASGNLELKYKI